MCFRINFKLFSQRLFALIGIRHAAFQFPLRRGFIAYKVRLNLYTTALQLALSQKDSK